VYALFRQLTLLDRRIVYLGMVAVLGIPFLAHYELPIYPETYTRRFFDTIEQIANDPVEREKTILVLHNWGPGTSGENEPQFDVVMRHLLRPRWDEQRQEWYKLRFVLLCSIVDPVFHDTALLAFERAQASEVARARRLGNPVPRWVYGEDYLDFGFKNAPVFAPFARSVIVNPREFYATDYLNHRDLTDDGSYPLLERYKSIEDVSAVIVVSAGDEARDIAGLVKSQHPDLRVAPATLGIVATDLYPYVKSGQLFGLLNSARGASEYRSLLDPDTPNTTDLDNSMSLGKVLLLVLVLLGNVAYVISRRGERTGRLPPVQRSARPPLPPLPKWFMWGLFGLFACAYGGSLFYDWARFAATGGAVRERVAREDDDPQASYPDWERVTVDDLADGLRAQAVSEHDTLAAEFADARARTLHQRMLVGRMGEMCAVFCTLGVFAFLLGDNRFYRLTEGIIVGGSMAYMLVAFDKLIVQQYFANIVAGFTGQRPPINILGLALLVPSALWYFTYSKRYRWLNQLIVACFLGLAIGPEFEKQINLVIPQVMDSIRPVWPWVADEVTGQSEFRYARFEDLVFVLAAVLSLTYFIFFFRPRGRAGKGVLTAGRLVMMVGFGASFGNTVNTRLSWLAPRIGFLIEDWFGKLLGA